MKKIYFILALMCACMYMNAEELFSKTFASFDGTTYFYSITGITAGTTCPNDLVIPDSLATSPLTDGTTMLAVKQIADNAFNGLPINSVKIPAPVEMIGANAFNNCTSLRRMYIYADYTKLTLGGASALTFNNDFAALYVPKESVEGFKVNLGFDQFFPGGIFPIEEGAVSVTTATVAADTPERCTVDFVWFLQSGVEQYELTVLDEDMEPIYTKPLLFDEKGNKKTGTSESGNMPARQLETTTTMDVGVASIGPLGSKKKYSYDIKGTDSSNKVIMHKTGSFSIDLSGEKPSIEQEHKNALTPTGTEETKIREQSARKVIIGGVVYIEKDGQLLNLLGQEVRL